MANYNQTFMGEGAGEESPEFGFWQKPRRTLVSSGVNPREVSIAGQQLVVITSMASQQLAPSLASPLRKKRMISLVHDLSSYKAFQHSISPPLWSLAAMLVDSAGRSLPETVVFRRRRRATVVNRKVVFEAIWKNWCGFFVVVNGNFCVCVIRLACDGSNLYWFFGVSGD